MKKTEYIVQCMPDIDEKKQWRDLDNKGNDKKAALESFKDFKEGNFFKIRLIERVTTEKRLR